jgi:hypothetical protein
MKQNHCLTTQNVQNVGQQIRLEEVYGGIYNLTKALTKHLKQIRRNGGSSGNNPK